MKTAEKATAHILIKANTNSEWDNCEFAIIQLCEQWRKEQEKRLKAVKSFAEDHNFQSVNYYDTAVDFYRTDENDQPDIDKMLADKHWAFVELENEEQETFTVPENRLNCYRLVLRADSTAYYTAYGKQTNEEFWTEEFSLLQLIEL